MTRYEDILPILVILAILFLIFLACREIVCWYWKINKTVDTLDEILAELKKMNKDKV